MIFLMRKIIFLIILSFILTAEVLHSQSYPFREYTVQDGLPQSQCSVITQDRRGFIWISTRNGLSRFDGSEFRNYFRKDGLPSNFANQLFEGQDGKLYALGEDGLSKFNGRKFILYPNPDKSTYTLLTQAELGIVDGNILILTYNTKRENWDLISFKNGIFSKYSELIPALDTINFGNFLYDRNEELLFLTKEGRFLGWKNNRLSEKSVQKFKNIFRDSGDIILEDGNDLYKYSANNLIQAGVEDGLISKSLENWFFTKSHIDLIKENTLFHIKIPASNITGLTTDKEGNLWLGAEKNVYRLLSTAFTTFSTDDLLIQNVWAISEDKNGHLWFGSLYGDLVEFDGNIFRKRNEYKYLFQTNVGFYKGSRKMSNGDIFFSMNQGVLIWDGNTFRKLKGIPSEAQVCTIYEDPVDKSVLIGTGIGLYHLKNGNIKFFPEFVNENLGVVEGVARESDGKYWLSGHRGLVYFDGTQGVHISDTVLPETYTYTLETDYKNGLWITSEEGLFFKAAGSHKFSEGLPTHINNSANSICLMDSVNLLIGGTTDICIINLDKFYNNDPDYYRIYDRFDGFSGKDCLDNGIIKDSKGRMLILTSDGVDILTPWNLLKNKFAPEVYITEIEQATDSLTWEIISEPELFYGKKSKLILKNDQNTLRISYTGISTTNPEKVTYQYRLLGYEEKWSERSRDRKVVYEKLPPGTYEFQLIAYNADGLKNSDPCTAGFIIMPAIWQTIGFKIVLLAIIIGISIFSTWMLMKSRNRKRQEQERMQMELSRLHLGSAIRQFDPHFTFNVLSSVGALIMTGEKELAYDHLIKLSCLLRSVLKDGSDIVKPLIEELDFVRKYLEIQKSRMGSRIEWDIYIDEKVDLRREVPKLIIQIFVENAIKHGLEAREEGGRLKVNINYNDEGLEINIRDNGIGREAAARSNSGGTGNGIKIITGIFHQMNKSNGKQARLEISDLFNNNVISGTEVKIIIPESYSFTFG